MAALQSVPPADPTPTDAPLPGLQKLFYLCALVTVIVWIQMVVGFFVESYSNKYGSYSYQIYLLILGAYGGTKEFKRLTGTLPPEAADQRLIRGEYFIWLWVLTGVAMAVYADIHGWSATKLPHDLSTVILGVLGIFAGTTCIKAAHEKRLPWSKSLPAPAPEPKPSKRERPAPEPDYPEGPPGHPAPAPSSGSRVELVKNILKVLQDQRNGLTRAEIQKAVDREKTVVAPLLLGLVKRDVLARISQYPGDPNTRYILKEYLNESSKDPEPPAYPESEPYPSVTKLDALIEGAIIGTLVTGERTGEELLAGAKSLYGSEVVRERVERAIDRLIAQGEIAPSTPGPRGPATRYRSLGE